jgi:hypothetical protein
MPLRAEKRSPGEFRRGYFESQIFIFKLPLLQFEAIIISNGKQPPTHSATIFYENRLSDSTPRPRQRLGAVASGAPPNNLNISRHG